MTDHAAEADWTAPERWAWQEIAAGRIANFDAEHGALDPLSGEGWGDKRTLGAAFLRAILFDRKWTDRLPLEGIRIAGARWSEPLDLPFAHLNRPLCLDRCRFEKPADLSGLRVEGRLSLRGSVFHGADSARGLVLEHAALRSADFSGATFRNGLAAKSASVDDLLDLSAATIEGELGLERLKAGCLFLRDGSAGEVNLTNAEIDEDLDFGGAELGGILKMNAIVIGQDLTLGGSATRASSFADKIILQAGFVGGNANLCGTSVAGDIAMNGLEVRKNFFMRAPLGDERTEQQGLARFGGRIDLTFAEIDGHLELMGAKFDGPVDLTSIQIGENLSGWGSRADPTIFDSGLLLSGARVKGAADFSGAVFRSDVHILAARIDGNLTLNGSRFDKDLFLADSRIGGHLFMNNAGHVRVKIRGEFRMHFATVCGQFEFGGRCYGLVSWSRLQVDRNLFLTPLSRRHRIAMPVFKQVVDIGYSEIKGTLDLGEATFEKILFLGSTRIGQDLLLRGRFCEGVSLSQARIGRRLDATAAVLDRLIDLGAATIEGRLSLKLPSRATAAGKGMLWDLRDAKVGSLQIFEPDDGTPWPEAGAVELDGLTYDRVGGGDPKDPEKLLERWAGWYITWLGLDAPYSPQPYEYLASVQRQGGQSEKANRILYAGRERVRAAAGAAGVFHRWLGLTLMKWSIGYGIGYGYFRALAWALAFTVIGYFALGPGPVGAAGPDNVQLTTWLDKAVYSFDQLLPIIELNRSFSGVKLPEAVEHYFYAHRILGFLLGSFIAAGVAGLTQRSKS